MSAHGGSYHPQDHRPRQQYVQPRGYRRFHQMTTAIFWTCFLFVIIFGLMMATSYLY